jgi:hypothetical protein
MLLDCDSIRAVRDGSFICDLLTRQREFSACYFINGSYSLRNCRNRKEGTMIVKKYGFFFPVVRIYRTEKVITRLLIAVFLIAMLSPLLCCNPVTSRIAHQRSLSSAYTHSGKYIQVNSINKSRNSIRKQNVKCKISNK